ncbi:HIG1 domain family member 2A [Fopius arisanus]|uniref:HIG1 domain family member 2A n=1 Tax=Fopius arisanus TaxID=64838 RepID=A0A9R1T3Y9_9HYME|nr:PREDICTED: HIG1 domain family member 2A [Fopius arisanus]
MTAKSIPESSPDLDWIKLREEMDHGISDETMTEKIIRKCKLQPLVPIGCLATTTALGFGFWTLKTGDRLMSQYMMRARVVAQGFTILVAAIGMIAASKTSQSE